jgi:hypothetical protein
MPAIRIFKRQVLFGAPTLSPLSIIHPSFSNIMTEVIFLFQVLTFPSQNSTNFIVDMQTIGHSFNLHFVHTSFILSAI